MGLKNASAWFWAGISVLAAIRMAGWTLPEAAPSMARDFPGWPLDLLPAGARLQGAEGGAVWVGDNISPYQAVFYAGNATWLVRWLPRATREAHPAEDCFRAQGYRLSNPRIEQDSEGVAWHTFEAERGGVRRKVQQRWVALDGRQWTDVSTWFWGARLGSVSAWSLTRVFSYEQ